MTDSTRPGAAPESCLRCGQDTAAGSVFFFDRHDVELPDGGRGYLCSECIERIRAAGLNAHDANVTFTPHGATMMWFGGLDLRRRDI